ncbi:hypothetical protein HYP67_gp058 [Acinetobacter phage vB_ApiM_fHyAci03]|uniref:Major capsid protein n=1 Tax=Acinetobacter phage vB_ApiM_fHyAci03 TaxID=2269366 RepID=A0A345AUP4_9CAUD|nr:hypothetical protein HYP67_gp058 [Acinetobacter phage vB_ApiM_fHyAci03]AXF40627.1 hypothetical protein Ac3_058 [Acinetobacter phage vB_ApiM_fHyAci03]
MSISGAAKTVVDSAYAFRFIRLIQKDFKEWKAFETGIIDEKGNVLKRPKTDEEKSSYTPFHGAVRALKKNLSVIPSASTLTTISSSLSAIGSRFGLTESEVQMIEEHVMTLVEEMVAGDAEGNPTNIASGTTTGAVVNAGPQTINKKRKSLAEVYYDK